MGLSKTVKPQGKEIPTDVCSLVSIDVGIGVFAS